MPTKRQVAASAQEEIDPEAEAERNREIEKWANDPRWSVIGHPAHSPDGPLDYVKLATAAVIMFALWPLVAAIFGREVWMARKILGRDGWIKWWLSLVVSGAGWLGLLWLALGG